MAIVKLNQKLKRLEVDSFEVSNDLVFSYFDRISAENRENTLFRALYIGVLALMEDRISAFFAKTTNELGTELENLKLIFEMKKELFYKTTIKGTLAEGEIAEFLRTYFAEHGVDDKVILTGASAGIIPKNKTGDIVCEISDRPDIKIAIECKFDKGIRLGEIGTKDSFTRRSDTAWSQLLEAQANRDAKISLIVFDRALVDSSILRSYEHVGFIDGVGLIAIIDSQKGDFTNLVIAYMLARDIAVNSMTVNLDKAVLLMMVEKVIKDLNEILTIKALVSANIENSKAILKQLEKSMLLMEFNREYLSKFLKDGTLGKKDMLDFYFTEGVRERYRVLEQTLEKL